MDKAISFIADSKQVAPNKPFFMYFCPGACHAPHHVPKEWADKYKGKFDDGWDKLREKTLARQKELGIVPSDAHQEKIWVSDGDELWKDIDKKRQAIVHEEDTLEVNPEYLHRAINHFQKIILGIALNAQVDQGIKFKWGLASGFMKSKEKPTLKG